MVKTSNDIDRISFLFENQVMLRLLRHLLSNDDAFISASELKEAVKVKGASFTKTLKSLEKAGLLKTSKRKSGKAYRLDKSSDLVKPLRQLLQFDYVSNRAALRAEFKSIKGIQAIIFSGNITDNSRSEVDIVAVGNKVDEKKFEALLKKLGFQTGFELSYILLTPAEYEYRQEMNDRLIRNILDFEHVIILGK